MDAVGKRTITRVIELASTMTVSFSPVSHTSREDPWQITRPTEEQAWETCRGTSGTATCSITKTTT